MFCCFSFTLPSGRDRNLTSTHLHMITLSRFTIVPAVPVVVVAAR